MNTEEPPKWCGDCGRRLPRENFAYKYRQLRVLQSCCRPCQSIRARAHYQMHTAKYKDRIAKNNTAIRRANRQRLHEFLAQQQCADCGLDDWAVLEFDHRDRTTKLRDVSTLVRKMYSWSAIVAEMSKCDVVCANCHRRRTARQFGWHKLAQPQLPMLPLLPPRGSADYEAIKSRRSGIARRHRNRLLVWEYLQSHPCVVCGESNPVVLDFDHVSDKYRDVGWLIGATCRAAILLEIAKCRVLCANCHRRNTAATASRTR